MARRKNTASLPETYAFGPYVECMVYNIGQNTIF